MRQVLKEIVPENPNQPYDMKEVIAGIVDEDTFHEVHKDFAENMIVGFARLAGKSVGVVANQPAYLAGVLDIHASTKGARFVRFCDSFNIPLLVLEDVPGFLPGTDQEWNGIITNGAKLLYAFSADMNFAWPTAEIAVMGAKGAAEIIFRKDIQAAEDNAAKLAEKEAEYSDAFANPYRAAYRGYVDDVILPEETREKLIKAFSMLENKAVKLPKKKHGNLPL
jgi:propionyl-CoA carboxylase beta chain